MAKANTIWVYSPSKQYEHRASEAIVTCLMEVQYSVTEEILSQVVENRHD